MDPGMSLHTNTPIESMKANDAPTVSQRHPDQRGATSDLASFRNDD
jgi:hypothetical protein